MKGKQLRKALALIGGFVGSAAMVAGPAYAAWAFNQTAGKAGTAKASVGGEIDTPLISASGGWLNQTVLFENNDGFIDGTLHYSGYTSGSADVTATQGDANMYSTALGHVGAATYSYSAYMTSPIAWPSQTATETFSMPAPTNNVTGRITSSQSQYYVGDSVKFSYTLSETSYPEVLAAISSSVYISFIWTTSSTSTSSSSSWDWALSSFTRSGTSWSHTDSNAISTNSVYYVRCQVQDRLTGLSSEWKTIATVSPVSYISTPTIALERESFTPIYQNNVTTLVPDVVFNITSYSTGTLHFFFQGTETNFSDKGNGLYESNVRYADSTSAKTYTATAYVVSPLGTKSSTATFSVTLSGRTTISCTAKNTQTGWFNAQETASFQWTTSNPINFEGVMVDHNSNSQGGHQTATSATSFTDSAAWNCSYNDRGTCIGWLRCSVQGYNYKTYWIRASITYETTSMISCTITTDYATSISF